MGDWNMEWICGGTVFGLRLNSAIESGVCMLDTWKRRLQNFNPREELNKLKSLEQIFSSLENQVAVLDSSYSLGLAKGNNFTVLIGTRF
jgi:hypothetical protein